MKAGILFFVPGKPVPKQSVKKGAYGYYTPKRMKEWQETVREHAALARARNRQFETLEGHVECKIVFCLPDYRRRDYDNLSKAVLDGCNGIIWMDDTQVMHADVTKVKRPDKLGVYIMAYEIDEPSVPEWCDGVE